MIQVMVIDGDQAFTELVRSRLECLGMSVTTLTNPLVAAFAVGEAKPDVLLIDYKTCCVSGGGEKVVTMLKRYGRGESEIALVSDDDEVMATAIELGICYLDKTRFASEDFLEEEVLRLAKKRRGWGG